MDSDKEEPRSDPRTPDALRKRPGDELETQTPSKRQKNKTPQTTPHLNRNETPIVTPWTEARYGLGKPIVSKLAKQVSAFLVELVTFMISWGFERDGQFTDRELGEKLKTFIDQIPHKRTYSTLVEADQRNMLAANQVQMGGAIKTSDDPARLLEGYDIVDSFYEQHEIDLTYTVLTSEAGCRQIIGRFLNNAMRAASIKFDLPSCAVFHEYNIFHPDLPGIGYISGPVDYLVADTVGDLTLKETGGAVVPGSRRFLVVEAKQSATLSLTVSYTQLYAQLFTLQNDDENHPAHAGVITDGSTWQFFILSRLEDGTSRIYGTGKIISQDKPSCQKVLGLLSFFIGGQIPSTDKTEPIYLEEKKHVKRVVA